MSYKNPTTQFYKSLMRFLQESYKVLIRVLYKSLIKLLYESYKCVCCVCKGRGREGREGEIDNIVNPQARGGEYMIN